MRQKRKNAAAERKKGEAEKKEKKDGYRAGRALKRNNVEPPGAREPQATDRASRCHPMQQEFTGAPGTSPSTKFLSDIFQFRTAPSVSVNCGLRSRNR